MTGVQTCALPISSGDDQIYGDVFGPRHVPEEPNERVHSLARAYTHLVVAQLAEDALGGKGLPAHVAGVHRGVLDQEEAR